MSQTEEFTLAELAVIIELAEKYLFFLSDMKDSRKSIFTKVSIFKLFISESYLKYTRFLLDMCYQYNDSRASIIEEEYMSAIASTIYSGTSTIQKKIIYEGLRRKQ